MNHRALTTQYGTVDEFLSIYSDDTKAAAARLLTDDRMRPYWDDVFGAAEFEKAVHVFELAHARRPWDRQSRRVQDDWQRKFDKTLDKLVELLESAPMDTEERGFPVRDGLLLEIARRIGADVPKSEPDVWHAMIRFNEAVASIPFSMIDFMRDFQNMQHAALHIEEPQALAKPNDPQAPRAFFLRGLQKYCSDLSAVTVATVASVMFQEDVDDRKARQYRPDGLFTKQKKPA